MGLKISGPQQRWPRPLPGAILIPPVLLVVADSLQEDIAMFQHVKDAGDILGIKLLENIVLSTGGTVRFL